jgi:hypothetical protein
MVVDGRGEGPVGEIGRRPAHDSLAGTGGGGDGEGERDRYRAGNGGGR